MTRIVPHPNIVQLRAITFEKPPRLLMQLVSNHTTADEALRQHPFPSEEHVSEALRILSAVSDAVAHLHGHIPPLVHRDLAPRNVLVAHTGQVFLSDFGLSRETSLGEYFISDENYDRPLRRSPMEWHLFCSWRPESDVFMFGLMAVEMFCNTEEIWPPEYDEDEVLIGLAKGTLSPHRIPITAGAGLQRLVDEMLSADFHDRPLMVVVHERLADCNQRRLEAKVHAMSPGNSPSEGPSAHSFTTRAPLVIEESFEIGSPRSQSTKSDPDRPQPETSTNNQ